MQLRQQLETIARQVDAGDFADRCFSDLGYATIGPVSMLSGQGRPYSTFQTDGHINED
jgi:hypothetical protein